MKYSDNSWTSDYRTDSIIQDSLRNELKDITLITVAHRLQTIMDADKIVRFQREVLFEILY